MSAVKFSIIIPVYKVEKHIQRCLESILNQKVPSWQCILIDDGSPDNSGAICDEYAKKDPRFVVIHKKNSGVSSARNEGLKIAAGDWIAFVDSDDYVKPFWLDSFNDSNNADVIIQGYDCKQKNDLQTIRYDERELCKIEIFKELENQEKVNGLMFRSPWNKCIKKSIILANNILFDERFSIAEDFLFNLTVLKYIDKIKISNQAGYVYNNEYSVLSKKLHPIDKMLLQTREFEKLALDLQEKFENKNTYDIIMQSRIHSLLRFTYSTKESKSQRMHAIDYVRIVIEKGRFKFPIYYRWIYNNSALYRSIMDSIVNILLNILRPFYYKLKGKQ